VKVGDIRYPCDAPELTANKGYLQACWSEQASIAYAQTRGNVSQIIDLCLSSGEHNNQQACFDGLARQLHPITQGDAAKMQADCHLMPGEWEADCLGSMVGTAFSTGDRSASYILCGQATTANKEACYRQLLYLVRIVSRSKQEQVLLCDKITDDKYRKRCSVFLEQLPY
jgi:hypothetical protein